MTTNYTPAELAAEREYRRVERLGILLGNRPQTLTAALIADSEADAAIETLRDSTMRQPELI